MIPVQGFEILVLLFAAHFVCDYPLQGDWLSKAKNHEMRLVPGEAIWPMALFGHALIHATAVYIITGSWWLFWAELIAHTIIDYTKCSGKIGYNMDQTLHLLCKYFWFMAVVMFTLP